MPLQKSNIVAILQVRTGSTRLPNKALYPLLGAPMVSHVMSRVSRSQTLSKFVLATTTLPQDNVLEEWAKQQAWACYRNDAANKGDVLGLYYHAACEYKADIVVRLTGDNPLIDPIVIDHVVGTYLQNDADYVGNCEFPLTYPIGIAVEVFSFKVLERSHFEDNNPAWREHVTQYIRQQPEKFKILPVYNSKDYSYLRWTMDELDDYHVARRIFEHFGHNNFSMVEAIRGL